MCSKTAAMLLCLQVLTLSGAAVKRAHAQEYLAQAIPAQTNPAQINPAQINPAQINGPPVLWTLNARPDTCVALHKGQECFQEIRLFWTAPGGTRLCLFSAAVEQALHCSTADQAIYRHEYASKSSERFYLRQGESGPLLAEVLVNTAWVYRTGRRSSSSWRLF